MKIEIKKSTKLIEYKEAIDFLEKRVIQVSQNKLSELIWILEHPSTYTAGTGFDEKDILDKSIKVVKTNRGGKITYHGPGQTVCYFVINLNKRNKDIRKFTKIIEKTIIDTLNEYSINSFSDPKNIGIWVNHKKKIKKIAAIGIKVKKWVAYHGFSINVSNDLKYYKNIIPCGISDKGVTRIKNLTSKNLKNIDKIIKENLIFSFKKI